MSQLLLREAYRTVETIEKYGTNVRGITLLQENGRLRMMGKGRNSKMQLITRESPLTPRRVSQDNGLLGAVAESPSVSTFKNRQQSTGNRALGNSLALRRKGGN